jgi:hypothetical protein
MSYTLLGNLHAALTGSSALTNLVASQYIVKNTPVKVAAIGHTYLPVQAMISVEPQDFGSQKISEDPVFLVDIRTTKPTFGDGGAEQCAEIANAVKTALVNGFTGATVSKMQGTVIFDKTINGFRCKLQVYCHALATITLTLSPALASPQAAGTELLFTAVASPNTGLEYRFLISGPGTGSAQRDMTGWQSRNSFVWRPGVADIGVTTVTLEVRGGTNKAAADQSTTASYTIIADPGTPGPGSAPTITSLTPNIASPQVDQTKIDYICVANDADNDQLYYRFFLTGPGTASKKKLVQDWSHRNSWQWMPQPYDVGDSTIEVQLRDGLHAAEGSYDDSETVSYTITPASGYAGPGSAPTITSLTPSLASPQVNGTKLDIICVASDADNDQLYYRFFLIGPGTASKKKLVQDWSHKNAWAWTPEAGDIGVSTIEVQLRDGLHASEGSFDDNETVSYTVNTAVGTGSGTAPTITSLTPHLASSQESGTLIDFICVAADVDSDNIYYRFFLTGPGTASKKRLMQDWAHRNSWEWNTRVQDVGVSTIEVQIRDGNNAVEGSYDAATTVTYTITAAAGTGVGTPPTVTSLTPSLSSPRMAGTALDFICIAADVDTDAILYRFFLTGPGTASKKKLVQDWGKKNAWQWTPAATDIGTSTIEVQVRDANNAGEGSYDDSKTASFTVSTNTAPWIAVNQRVLNESGSNIFVGDKIHVAAQAVESNPEATYYKFFIFRGAVNVVWEALTDWQKLNAISYTVDKMDYGTLTFRIWARDGQHAAEDSYDGQETIAATILRAAITSVTPSLASSQAHETTVVFSTLANKTTKIYYRFWLKGTGTGNVWRDMTGWQARNSWSWRTLACDIGTNYVRAEVCDNPDTWVDSDVTNRQNDTTYVIS